MAVAATITRPAWDLGLVSHEASCHISTSCRKGKGRAGPGGSLLCSAASRASCRGHDPGPAGRTRPARTWWPRPSSAVGKQVWFIGSERKWSPLGVRAKMETCCAQIPDPGDSGESFQTPESTGPGRDVSACPGGVFWQGEVERPLCRRRKAAGLKDSSGSHRRTRRGSQTHTRVCATPKPAFWTPEGSVGLPGHAALQNDNVPAVLTREAVLIPLPSVATKSL